MTSITLFRKIIFLFLVVLSSIKDRQTVQTGVFRRWLGVSEYHQSAAEQLQ